MVLGEGLPRQPGCYCNDDIIQQHFSVHLMFALSNVKSLYHLIIKDPMWIKLKANQG